MCRKISLCVGIALMVVGSLLVGSASATFLDIQNASFESPSLSDGGVSDEVPDWTVARAGAVIQTWNPDAASFTGAGGNGTPLGGDGANLVYFLSNTYFSYITNQLSNTLQAGTYTLTAAVGNINGVTGNDFQFGLYTTGTTTGYLASYFGSASELLSGQLADKTAVLNVTSSNPYLGQPIVIAIAGGTTAGGYVAFDNVRLDFVAAPSPEPGTMILLGIGLLGLLCYAWQKRK